MKGKIDLAQKGEERSGVRKEDEKGTSGIAQIEKGSPTRCSDHIKCQAI